jgi:hypothetical protein
MNLLIRQDPLLFLWVKLGLATVGLMFLALHQTFPHVRLAVRVLFAIFGALIGYHFLVMAGS